VAADEPACDQVGGDARPAAELEDHVVGLDVEQIDGPRHAVGHLGTHGSTPDRDAAPGRSATQIACVRPGLPAGDH
jgi:hypothetical protein